MDLLTLFFNGFLSYVMTCSYVIRTNRHRSLEKQIEFDFTVTQHIWIRSSTLLVFAEHIINNTLLVGSAHINDLKWNTELVRNEHGIIAVLNPRALVVYGHTLVYPIAHK